ncbi:hypothetical protein DPMN_098639 [Dreissena polymorpha]|uniref:Uncharacterized protein n=1 Tax=Dreissena polymorpha TaxID=45954 RepID=A0A9D4LE04_DREPO|nr:hypothetical protein DPMN_098639 [Dreissena polymorpha]
MAPMLYQRLLYAIKSRLDPECTNHPGPRRSTGVSKPGWTGALPANVTRSKVKERSDVEVRGLRLSTRFDFKCTNIIAQQRDLLRDSRRGVKAQSHYDAGGAPLRDPGSTGNNRDGTGTTGTAP